MNTPTQPTPTPRTASRLSWARASLSRSLRLSNLRSTKLARPEGEQAFFEQTQRLALNQSIIGSLFVCVSVLFWWPLDASVSPSALGVEALSQVRWAALAIALAALVVYTSSAWARRQALWLTPVFFAMAFVVCGYQVGKLGGPDQPWHANGLVTIVPIALLPLSFGPRVVATALNHGAFAFGFFVMNPENLHHPMASGQLSFTVFAYLLTVATGEVLYRSMRGAFLQRRALQGARRALVAWRRRLEERVEEQTFQLRALAKTLDDALETERRRISSELHDELGQAMTAMRLYLTMTLRRHPTGQSPVAAPVEQLAELLGRATTTSRALMTSLRPKVLEDLGLHAALDWLARTTTSNGLSTRVSIPPEVDAAIRGPVALTLFRVIQEACSNAARHAGASHLTILVTSIDDVVLAEVHDDGCGFDPSAQPPGFGLLSMRERVRAHDGELSIETRAGLGTVIRVRLPLPAELVGGDATSHAGHAEGDHAEGAPGDAREAGDGDDVPASRPGTSPRSPLDWIRHAVKQTLPLLNTDATNRLSAADRVHFAGYVRRLAADQALVASALMGVAVLLWWPIDRLVQPTTSSLDAFGLLRSMSIVVILGFFTAVAVSTTVRRHILVAASSAYALCYGVVGYCLGLAGGPDLPWFGDALVVIVPSALLPLAFTHRVIVTAAICWSFLIGYFGLHPEHLQHAFTPSMLSFTLFAFLLTVTTGEILSRSYLRSFLQERSIDAASGSLDAASESLEARIEGQTQELRILTRHLDEALQTERRRIAVQLQDELGQDLIAMRLSLSMAMKRFPEGQSESGAQLVQLAELLDQAIATSRSVVTGLRPKELEEHGLRASLDGLANSVAMSGGLDAAVRFESDVEFILTPALGLAMYRVAQEACTNTLKHADAKKLRIRVRFVGELIELEIADDGDGFDVKGRPSGYGLLSMRERARSQGGTLTVTSVRQHGTIVRALFPRPGADPLEAPRTPSRPREPVPRPELARR
ncbi:MAG: sensor histidine kinase [Myxococcales bacterium]|nr:sensor histidine kinase [Myxococcales bacterium]